MKKAIDERIDEGVLRWFGNVERMEKDRIAKRVYVGKCTGSRSVGRLRKRWTDKVKECLKKTGLDVKQARGIPDLDEIPQLYKALEGWKSVCGRAYNLKDIKGKIFCFSSLS